jgi:hypothetical protein
LELERARIAASSGVVAGGLLRGPNRILVRDASVSPIVQQFLGWAVRPEIQRQGLPFMDACTLTMSTVNDANWIASRSAVARASVPPLSTSSPADWIQRWDVANTCESLMFRHRSSSADRRAAAILLALQLYAVDHHGQLPKSLAELIPAYLPILPDDPFAAPGRPFGYVATGNIPYIYSLGPDGVDERSSNGWSPDWTTFSSRNKWPDHPYPIGRLPPTAAPPPGQ